MNLFNKVFRLAGRVAAKSGGVDPTAVIRSALGAAGLMGPQGRGTGAVDPLSCLAAAGLSNDLDRLLPALRRRPGPRADEAAAPLAAGGRFTWQTIAGEWGERRYRLFLPEGTPEALVVMLHGCSQNPDDFAAGTRMNALALARNVAVAYPEQTTGANMSACWNWFNPADQKRGRGEPAMIAAITRRVAAELHIPADRCFVAGLSAGGAMAAIMAETYPDLYGAVGVHSGLPYLAATDMSSAFGAMQGHGLKAPYPVEAGMPMIVFHGDADRTVHPGNADNLVARLAAGQPGLRTAEERGRSAGGLAYRRTTASDDRGRVRYEDWRLADAGHAWSGGSPAGSYTDPAGPDASAEMLRFFLDATRAERPPSRRAAAPA